MANAASLTEYLADDALTLPPRIDTEAVIREIVDLHRQHGGATFSLYFGNMAGQPVYAVSLYPNRSEPLLGAQVPERVLRRFLRDNEDLLREPRNCIGTWHVVATQQTILDVSATLSDRAAAEKMGRRYNQIAIFDLEAAEEIDTGGTGAELAGWPPEAERLPPLKRGDSHGTDE